MSIRARLRSLRPGRTAILGVYLGFPVALSALLGAAYFALGALPPVPEPPQNPITEPKRVLGKILFWDEQLSASNTMSCGTCHSPARGGYEGRSARNPGVDGVLNTPDDILGSPGVVRADVSADYKPDAVFALNTQITGRTAGTPIDSGYLNLAFWDGRASSTFTDPQTGQVAIPVGGALESQSVGPPTSDAEMAHESIDWTELTTKLRRVNPLDLATNIPGDVSPALADQPSYPELFRRAFGDPAITARRIAFAIATYERTLVADDTPWDRFQAGQQNALTPGQVQGMNAFQASRCAVCHTPGLFSDQTFRNIGLRPPAEDLGRQNVTGNTADRGKFKVPSLRNTGLKRVWMHNGQFSSLTQVIQFYARAPGAAPQFPDNRDPIMPQVNVPPQVAPALQDFIQNALTDARVANQTFPFDHPTLVTQRAANLASNLGGGVAGSGGIVPRVIALDPPMIGNHEFRIGLDGALGATASATLSFSTNPPVNGRITPQGLIGTAMVRGTGNGNGYATIHWPLDPANVSPGQVLYVQWSVPDAGAAGGQALSSVVRIPFFCGSYGCPACIADFNRSGGTPDDADVGAFFQAWHNGDPSADVNFSGGTPDDADAVYFFQRWEEGC